MNEELRIRARKSPGAFFDLLFDCIDLHAYTYTRGAKEGVSFATGIKFEEVSRFTETPPLLAIDGTAAQVLMDDLWACGIRPTEGAGSAGAIRAVERHLGDMRRIAEVKLDLDLRMGK